MVSAHGAERPLMRRAVSILSFISLTKTPDVSHVSDVIVSRLCLPIIVSSEANGLRDALRAY
jgi:hypothetical protein